ncbi:MAG TPA: ABC transporter ATP-binding protein [Candidatus Acidoferrales bacterium]|jgi:ATP-binding cassette subfamily B multidrug efflux pump|nr:ABC transporter ATP-binding protein [Candidatus Acidoferrales bacterium]
MSDFREEEALGKAYDARLVQRLAQYLRPYKVLVFVALAVTLLVAPLEAAGPYLFKIATDKFILPAFHGAISAAAGFHGLGLVTLAFLASLILSFAFQYLQMRIMQDVGQKTMYDMRKQIFSHLQALPMSFYDRNPVGRLVTRVTTDVDALNDLFATGVVAMINDAVLLLMFVAILFRMDWRLALESLCVLPLIIVATWMFRNKTRDGNRRIRTAIARINAFLNEHIMGMPVVQLFNRERRTRDDFAKFNQNYVEAYKDVIFAFALFLPGVEFLSTLAIALVFWRGGIRVIDHAVQLGTLVAFMQYAQRFFRPIQDLSDKFNILQSAMAASERIFKLVDEPIPADTASGSRKIERPLGEIEFRNVWFAYRGGANPAEDDWVLRDVSFRVAPRETAAIVGHTGAGKTTVVQLLLRFYEIQRGQILLDGVDIREFDVQELRRQFGIVLQDPFLFTGTLESNVRLGTEGITREKVESSLREVGLGPLIDSLPQGIETGITERGATLSVGQRQLVSFARALAHDPRFMILDEATSSVDTKTEQMIREALDRLLEGRTALVIAHRLSTIQYAGTILVFHKGRLREQGSHQALLAARGIYYRLYQLQYKDQELRMQLPPTGEAAGASLPASD